MRLETGDGTLVYLAANPLQLAVPVAPPCASGSGPETGHDPNCGCSPTSKPCETYEAAWALVSVALGYMYDVERTHSHCATSQPAGLSAL